MKNYCKKASAGFLAFLMMAVIGVSLTASGEDPHGFEGVSWKPVAPLSRITFVGFDKQSYLDDFGYMAAIPANVFHDSNAGLIYASPLLYYEPAVTEGGIYETLNANKGLKYFSDDWNGYCGGAVDQMQLINVDSVSDMPINATDTLKINADNPYALAAEIADANWKSSGVAVVAAIQSGFEDLNEKTHGSINGTVPAAYKTNAFLIENSREVGVLPQYNNFSIDAPYKFIVADMTWDFIPGAGEVPSPLYAIDPDLQLYDFSMGQVSASEGWMSPSEYCASYIYNHGQWSAAVTYMPTKQTVSLDSYPDVKEAVTSAQTALDDTNRPLMQPSTTTANYRINVETYPGDEYALLDSTPYSCREGTFRLSWDNTDAELGFVVRDPAGAELGAAIEKGKSSQELIFNRMGEGAYTVTILKLNDAASDVKFTLEYDWTQFRSKAEGEALESAAEGAVLASTLNAPLLYVDFAEIPDETANTLERLGVKTIHFVNLGGHADKNLASKLSAFGKVTEYDDYLEIYSKIQSITGQNDLIFTTVDPWSYWLAEKLQPEGEEPYATFIGPAAYLAAHHGSPVMVVDTHPELSCPAAWHTNDWLQKAKSRDFPSVGCMVLTGREVYRFVNESGFDGEGRESMITVADQFDIGVPWDRVFPGAALPGRIMGTPVDTGYWICRNVFYPALVFQNPGMAHGASRITGSHSDIDPLTGAFSIIPGGEVMVDYPVLQTWVCYEHRFNERASSYWGLDYTTADGITPFKQASPYPIDMGCNMPYATGQFYPDMSCSNVVPFYLNKLGYDSVFSTAFDPVMENINRGVLMWIEVMHGGQSGSGVVGFWYDEAQPEKNPWRCYEEFGSTSEPDSMSINKQVPLDVVPSNPATGYDGVVITVVSQFSQTTTKSGYDFDTALDNAYSAGFMGGSCLISNTLLHLSLVRHGFVFQVIDPWVTSWYSAFAFEMIPRYMAMGDTIGEAYEKSILHVGIGYMADSWWWDISENVEFFGDPDLKVYSPNFGWDEPEVVSLEYLSSVSGRKALADESGAKDKTPGFEAVTMIAGALVVAVIAAMRRRK
ncbi:MAG: hypothetical protein CVT48_04905 [Thermoplasmata archaeon HGW-Thermoplasmata-1]|nr:MAG: hypothetical protein CVT48_04905 [Thermoplasmata archaeon HGW-Thermoplasmata-1]